MENLDGNLGPYRLQALVGRGGMGVVHRALDTRSGEVVAVKRLLTAEAGLGERFAREARLLRELQHPNVVRYLDHGVDGRGDPYLVMEWLEGENFGDRVSRGALPIEEAVGVVRQVAAALSFAHDRGVVHRDVKPSNVFLLRGDSSDVRLLDFGIARQHQATHALTGSQAVIGTVGYMAPEQAMGSSGVDARADVFALGCLLFEALTGTPALAGPNLVAVLAKVLIEPAPSARVLRPEVSAALDTLCVEMMAKDPAARPADAGAALRALDQLPLRIESAQAPLGVRAQVTGAELRVISVVLAAPGTQAATAVATAAEPGLGPSVLDRALDRFGGTRFALADRAILAVWDGEDTVAHDRAARATRCALAICELCPDLRVVVATGRAETSTAIPIGPVIDRAATLLRHAEPGTGVVADPVTSSLLDARFDQRADAEFARVHGFHAGQLGPRRVLGHRTPCAGREKELRFLESLLEECGDERMLRVVSLVGSPGLGKSRIVAELIARWREAGGRSLHVRVDPVSSASPLALVRALLAAAAADLGGDAAELARARLVGGEAPLVPFLVALAGVDVPSDDPGFVAARGDVQVAAEQYARALAAWLAAEAEASPPLLLAIEDLQWADGPSAALLSDALRRRSEQPLLLVAAIREDGAARAGQLGPPGTVQELRLTPLSRRAAELVVRSVLGSHAPDATVSRIVAAAQGNPFHVEQLVRQAATGEDPGGSEPLLAITDARLAGLAPAERQVLRAASVLGETFAREALEAVTGPVGEPLDGVLDRLVAHEVLVAAGDGRSLSFAHGLLREAAYSALPAADRSRGHLAAGTFLEGSGFDGPLVLAEHFARGGDEARAARYGAAAADVALGVGDTTTALEIADRYGANAAPADTLHLRSLRIIVSVLHGRFDRALPLAEALLPEAEPGSDPWWSAAGTLLYAASNYPSPQLGRVMGHLLDFSRPLAHGEPTSALGGALFAAACGVISMGELGATSGLIARAEAYADAMPRRHISFDGFVGVSRAFRALAQERSPGSLRREAAASLELFERAGQSIGIAAAEGYVALGWLFSGDLERGEAHVTRCIESARVAGSVLNIGYGKGHRAALRLVAGRFAEGLEDEVELLTHPDAGVSLFARAYLAHAHAELGRAETARAILEPLVASPVAVGQALGRAVLARIALREGAVEEVERLTREGLELERRYSVMFELPLLALAREEALRRLDRHDEAREVLLTAGAELVRRAFTHDDDASREGFLSLPAHHELLVRARAAGLHLVVRDGPC